MKKSINKINVTAILILAALFLPLALNAQSPEIKQRMKARLPQIIKLKKAESIGENNKGYLHARKKLPNSENSLVQSENKDRKTIYTAIAKKVGDSSDAVARKRAKQIRQTAPKGTWVQAADGSWLKK